MEVGTAVVGLSQVENWSKAIWAEASTDEHRQSPRRAMPQRERGVTLHSNSIRSQLQVILPPHLSAARQSLLDVVEMAVDDLLRQRERAREDFSNEGELREEMRVRRRDGGVVLQRSARVRREAAHFRQQRHCLRSAFGVRGRGQPIKCKFTSTTQFRFSHSSDSLPDSHLPTASLRRSVQENRKDEI